MVKNAAIYVSVSLLGLLIGMVGVYISYSLIKTPSQVTSMTSPTLIQIPTTKPQDLEVLSWIPYWDQQQAFSSFQKNIEVFNHLSLFWYHIDVESTIKKYKATVEDKRILAFAHEHNVPVLMLVANMVDYGEEGGWSEERVQAVIGSEEARTKHVEELLKLLTEKGFDGVNIDYESLNESQRDDFTQFIRVLSIVLHAEDKILAVALHPKTGEGRPNEANGSEAQDWEELGKYADQLHLMTYGQHSTSTKPGPTATDEWMDKVITYALTKIPREKLYVGMGLYGNEWPEDKDGNARGLTTTQVDQIKSKYNPTIQRDRASGESFFVYEDDEGDTFTVWFMDKESLSYKAQRIARYGIKGIAFWRLGGEDEEVWGIFK
jgi:spore germination protein